MSNPKIEVSLINSQQILNMSIGSVSAKINAGEGANLFSLKDEECGLDILIDHDDPSNRALDFPFFGMPILFPPNRISGGAFSFNGKNYTLPINDAAGLNNYIHGFLYFEKWEILRTQVSNDHCTAVLCYNSTVDSPVYKLFPHLFHIELEYTLTKSGILTKIFVKNVDDIPLPFGLGFHTFVKLPFNKNGDISRCKMSVTIGKEWILDPANIPTGEKKDIKNEHTALTGEGLPLYGHALSNHFTAQPIERKGNMFNGAVITDDSVKQSVIYEVGKEFGHWMLWNGSGVDGFICPEPQTIVVDAFNTKDERDDTGFIALKPEETFETYEKVYWELQPDTQITNKANSN